MISSGISIKPFGLRTGKEIKRNLQDPKQARRPHVRSGGNAEQREITIVHQYSTCGRPGGRAYDHESPTTRLSVSDHRHPIFART